MTAGCLAGSEGDDTSNRNPPSEGDDAYSETGDSKRTGVEATIFGEERYPIDLESGQRLVVRASVNPGGPMVVDVANVDEGESIRDAVVTTDERIEPDVEADGSHYVTFQVHDEAAVTVTVVE